MDIEISIDSKAVEAALKLASAEGADLSQPMAEIAEVLAEGAQKRFETQIGPDNVPWQKSRRAIEDGDNPPTLTLTGQLKRQIVPDYGRDFARAGVLKTGGPGVYARIHQLGGTIKPKAGKALSFGGRLLAQVKMPARPYLGFGDFERQLTLDILNSHLKSLFGDKA